MKTSSNVRKANSKPELSQLLFISVRQKELIRVLTILDLSTYTTFSWSIYFLPMIPTKLCNIMCYDILVNNVTSFVTKCNMTFPCYLWKINKKKRKRKKKNNFRKCYQRAMIALSDHPWWMFKKNLMEFFIRLLNYLYYFTSGCTLLTHNHMSFWNILWSCDSVIW